MESPEDKKADSKSTDEKSPRKLSRKKTAVLVFIGLLLLNLIGPLIVTQSAKSRSLSEKDVSLLQPRDVAIVFGAGVDPDRRPTPFLLARLETAVELYKQGKVKKLLLSGDNRARNYNEPFVMREVVIELGVAAEDAIADYAGLGTYDSCYRAKHIFGVTNVYLVTQGYHVPRAVYTCQKIGIDSIGIGTSRYWSSYRGLVFPNYIVREIFSINRSLFKLHITKPEASIMGQPEPINF